MRSIEPSAFVTVPVVVYCMPGVSEYHLLSILGEDWKAVRSKLMADPGPQSSGPAAVAAGETAGAVVSASAAGEPVGVAASGAAVDGAGAGAGALFCAVHDTTVDIAKNSMSAEPHALDRLCGWNISVAFRRWNFAASSICLGPPSGGSTAGQRR